MLDGIVEQLEEAQEHGIWAWDVHLNEPVLVIPEVLALLGDNPMQSEFACHIGLRGKLFCRACWVKGTDALDPTGADDPLTGDNTAGSANGSDQSDADTQASDAESTGSKKAKGKGKRVKETMVQMVNRVKAFVTIGRLRNKSETTEKLRSYFVEASTLDTKTKVQTQRTESGVKDTYQLFFLEKLFQSYKGKRGRAAKQVALNARIAELPKITTSPVWRIKGLDPHQDTPVEILHVILLASTLVQYSGSLTGRDFRSIAQVAPFVVYDLVSPECFETWQALSKLVPLIWQPEIEDIEPHITLLTREIDHFLLCAARWTNRWFNKPKFHIILHLPAHIRRFGPAIMFATEAFESFNAIIRAKSVHSNRHAPSRDIAQAFAQGNRIRHLLSGGLFLLSSVSSPAREFSKDAALWKTIGLGPQNLVRLPSTVTSYLGLDSKREPAPGVCHVDKLRSRPVRETLTGQHIPHWSCRLGSFRTCTDVTLNNGDACIPGGFVIIRHPEHIGETYVAQVEEIIQEVGSLAAHTSLADGILVHKVRLLRELQRYGMPRILLSGERALLQASDLLCTSNVQHNCIDNNCGPAGSRPVYQERQITNHTRAEIAHLQNPTDLVLNTAQMRDAVHLQPFRIDTPAMDKDTIIHQSAANELAAAKQATAQTSTISTARPRQGSPAPVRVEPRVLTRVRE
ncbi:hypothetical protein B0H17DRAFT_1241343 [Mycena rosella]|uniref:Transposase n=1 Tax=Mycena rosella TaxID=1033263 RepID=A0AAD7AWX2_MYCRO|nr:hypothetical protein B0H17DRAFT_1241343 [Mycena rosella]